MKKVLILILANLVLLVATTGNYLDCHIKKDSKHSVTKKTSQNEENEQTDNYSINLYQVVPQITHLVFQSGFCFEFEFQEITDQKIHSVIETSLCFTKFYRTLFRLIISPNAP